MKIKEKEKEDAPSPPPPEKVLYDNRIKRKNVLALNEKVAAIREYEKLPVYKRIGRMFHCSPDQIKRIVQQKDSILKAWEQRTRRCQDAKTLEMKVVRVSMLGKAVYDWIRRMMYYKDFMITDGLIQKMALQFKSAMGLQNFFPHQDWCDKFRQTYKITENDSKLLKIGYTQGYSVQIKDVMKDVLSECTPDVAAADSENPEEDDDEQQKDENANERQKEKSDAVMSQQAKEAQPQARAFPQLQPIRQLVALPIRGTGNRAGMPQKVLVATPITTAAAGQRPGGAPPMTMTIIPLTTIAQKQQQQSQHKVAAPTTANDKQQTVPPPKLDIKQEIKEEPVEETTTAGIQIKQEYITDEEEEEDVQDITKEQKEERPTANDDGVKNDQATAVETNNTTQLSKIVDYDNVALSRLRKIIQNKGTPPEMPSNETATTSKAKVITTFNTLTPFTLPPLTRAPTPIATTTQTSTPTSTPTPTAVSAPLALNRTANKRKHNTDSSPALPAIKTCAEARKYLKLLEDFALVKENFRLIGLITRADEVLRELDGDDDVDID